MANEGNIFNPSETDVTVQMLNAVFGEGWMRILMGGGSESEHATALFTILGAFNTFILSGAVLMVVYVLVVGVMGTAHEGEALGKRYSTLWTPIRSVFALALLMPIPGVHISLIQAVLLVFVGAGIGGANYINATFLDYVRDSGGSIVSSPSLAHEGRNLATAFFSVRAAQWHFHLIDGHSFESYEMEWVDMEGSSVADRNVSTPAGTYNVRGEVELSDAESHAGYWKFQFQAPEGSGLRNEDMGSIRVFCLERNDPICNQRVTGIQQFNESASRVAASAVHHYITDGEEGNVPSMQEAINGAVDLSATYRAELEATLPDQIAQVDGQLSERIDNYVEEAKKLGWGMTGTFWWTISSFSEQAQESIASEPVITEMNVERILDATNNHRELSGVLSLVDSHAIDTDEAISNINDAANPQGDGFGGPVGDVLRESINNVTKDWPLSLVGAFGEGDPLAALQARGYQLINISWSIVGAWTAARLVASGADGQTNSFFGQAVGFVTGGAKQGAIEAFKTGVKIAGVIVSITVIPLFIMGIMLAYYVPAMPAILWMMAVIGWLILVFESIVASPLWAAAHASPQGEGFTGQHGHQGYMLFLGVLMRPSLMVIGFLMAYLVTQVVYNYLGMGFQIMIEGATDGRVFGPVTILALTFIIGGTAIAAQHKIFTLITWLPDNAMRWVGQQVQNLGEQQDEQRAKQVFGAFLSRGEARGAQMAQGIGSGAGGDGPEPDGDPDGPGGGNNEKTSNKGKAYGPNSVASNAADDESLQQESAQGGSPDGGDNDGGEDDPDPDGPDGGGAPSPGGGHGGNADDQSLASGETQGQGNAKDSSGNAANQSADGSASNATPSNGGNQGAGVSPQGGGAAAQNMPDGLDVGQTDGGSGQSKPGFMQQGQEANTDQGKSGSKEKGNHQNKGDEPENW